MSATSTLAAANEHQPQSLPPLSERLKGNADGILEQIAREYGTSTLAVVKALPAEHRTLVAGEQFARILERISTWGDIVFIVHTPDIVLECNGPVPPGTFGRGYFNIHGESPISGHIKADNCHEIAFVSRPFMGRPSCSVQFFNGSGEAMFKIFVRRDKARDLIAEQVANFNALRAEFA